MQFSKTALLALALALAAVAAADAKASARTLELHPEIPAEIEEDELLDVLPSELDRDPNPIVRAQTGDDERDALESVNAVQLASSEDSEVAEEDTIGWRNPSGVKMADAYAVGDPHFRSFDGQIFHFQGVGQFELVNCDNFQLQARNSVCGNHKTYGVVCCWLVAAIKYTDDLGNTDVVEVTTRGTITFKVNGNGVGNQDAAMKLKNGCEVVPTWYRSNGRSYKRVYVYCPGHNQAMITSYAIYVRRPACQKCANALLGNDDCNAKNDYVDLTGNDWDGKINSPNQAQDVQNKIDNNPNKPLRKWGLTFMVDDQKIKSFFGDKAKKYNHPELKPGKIQCDDQDFKKKAHEYCKGEALSYAFYTDCMMDACATNSLENSKKDVVAAKMYEEMKNDDNAHAGKISLLKTLGKMEVDFLTQRDTIAAAMKAEAAHVKGLGLKLGTAEKQEKQDCGVVPPCRNEAEKCHNHKEKCKGLLAGADKNLRDTVKEHDETMVVIKKEDALIRSMLNVLAKLVNVKSVEDLDIDHDALNQSPKLKAILVAAIQEGRHHREAKGNTDRIKTLLVELLYKLETETKRLDKEKEVAIADQKKASDDLDDATKKDDDAKAALEDSIQRCEEAKKDKGAANAAYRGAQFDQAKNNEVAGKELRDLRDEVEMVEGLKDTITDWNKKKDNFKKCKPSDMTSDIQGSQMTDEDYDNADKAIFMEDIETEDIEMPDSAPLPADQAVLNALESDL